MKKHFGILLVIAISWGLAQAEVYRYLDEQGNPVYSDRPQEGAEPVQLPGLSTFKPGKTPSSVSPPAAKKKFRYESVSIIKPLQDQTIRDNTGNITVQVQVMPSLQSGHKIEFDLDGNKIATVLSSHTYQNLERGSHTISVQVIDKDGNSVSDSATTQFYIHRYSKLLAPNKPKTSPR